MARLHLPPTDALDLATIMRAVGDPLRLEIVRKLAGGRSAPCGELADELGIPDATCSYHLLQLREAGVTRSQAAGTLRIISLRTEDLEARFPGLPAVLAGRPKA